MATDVESLLDRELIENCVARVALNGRDVEQMATDVKSLLGCELIRNGIARVARHSKER